MKVIRNNNEEFKPVTVEFENQREIDCVIAALELYPKDKCHNGEAVLEVLNDFRGHENEINLFKTIITMPMKPRDRYGEFYHIFNREKAAYLIGSPVYYSNSLDGITCRIIKNEGVYLGIENSITAHVFRVRDKNGREEIYQFIIPIEENNNAE